MSVHLSEDDLLLLSRALNQFARDKQEQSRAALTAARIYDANSEALQAWALRGRLRTLLGSGDQFTLKAR